MGMFIVERSARCKSAAACLGLADSGAVLRKAEAPGCVSSFRVPGKPEAFTSGVA